MLVAMRDSALIPCSGGCRFTGERCFPPLEKLSIFSFCTNNPQNPFSPHYRGEKVRMRGPFLTLAREWLRRNVFHTEPLTPPLSPHALRGEGSRKLRTVVCIAVDPFYDSRFDEREGCTSAHEARELVRFGTLQT
jgi:hypothetical protein